MRGRGGTAKLKVHDPSFTILDQLLRNVVGRLPGLLIWVQNLCHGWPGNCPPLHSGSRSG